MAATHRVEIRKNLGAANWSNDYLIQATDMDDAVATANALVTMERHLHYDNILFVFVRVSQNNPLTRVFRHIGLNVYGLQSLGGAEYLPLFCTVRVDFTTDNSDPSRKYYRMPVMEAWQSNGVISGTQVTALNALLTTYFLGSVAGDNIYTPKGNLVTGAAVYPNVQMRQQHRRHKKKPA